MKVEFNQLVGSMQWEVNLPMEDRLILADFMEVNNYFDEDLLSLLRDNNRKCVIQEGEIVAGEYQEWEYCSYDVWGNEEDGWEVNDVYRQNEIQLFAEEKKYNEIKYEYMVSDEEIKKILSTNRQLEIDGDDTTIYVTLARNGKPFCEFRKCQ